MRFKVLMNMYVCEITDVTHTHKIWDNAAVNLSLFLKLSGLKCEKQKTGTTQTLCKPQKQTVNML